MMATVMETTDGGNLICGHVSERAVVHVKGAGATVENDGVRLGDEMISFVVMRALPDGRYIFAEPVAGWPWIVVTKRSVAPQWP